MKEIRVRMAADSHIKMRCDLHSRRKQTDKIKEQTKKRKTTKIEPLIKAGCRIWRLFLDLTRDASRKTWNRTRLETSSNCVKLHMVFYFAPMFLDKIFNWHILETYVQFFTLLLIHFSEFCYYSNWYFFSFLSFFYYFLFFNLDLDLFNYDLSHFINFWQTFYEIYIEIWRKYMKKNIMI